MGIVSDKDFESETNKLNIPIKPEPKPVTTTAEIIESPKKGRGEGNVEVPNGLRKVIADTAISEGREAALSLAKDFGISPSSVSAYTNGSTSTSSYDERPNVNLINQAKERISKKARRTLVKAIDNITDDKLVNANPVALSTVARNMSAVVKDMEPEREKEPLAGGPTFVFYSPQYRKEESFDTVYAKE